MSRTVMKTLHYPHVEKLKFHKKETQEIRKKRKKPKNKNKNTYLVALSNGCRRLNSLQIIFFNFGSLTSFDLISEHSKCLTQLTYSSLKDLSPMT